ncbi:MAG TPA: hypothetical protein VEG25_00310 [Burkholderiales bacterium]|nr:hypothetical protein [Burkholderiales bacterium]
MQRELRVKREMAISHADFLRTLPSALNNKRYALNGDKITLQSENRTLQIFLSPEFSRQLGSVSLPVTHVEFVFSGYSAPEVDRIIERFEMYYRRGGG